MVKLLDYNMLIALARTEHVAHEKVKRWFKQMGVTGLGYMRADGIWLCEDRE